MAFNSDLEIYLKLIKTLISLSCTKYGWQFATQKDKETSALATRT